ncbi:uncharacterized protein ACNS7B_020749 [Menidia menidia]
MAAAVLLLMVSLLHLLAAQGPGVLFIKSGSDLLLDANTTLRISENAFLVWKFKEIQNIVRFMFGSQNATLHQSWRDRARLFKTNYSLLLNKVTVSDSGSYDALFSGDDDKYVAKYKVQVQDPVSPVHLTVSSSSSSSLSCNLTVTCSTGNSNIHAAIQCHNQTCSLENSTMHSPHLYIYLESDHIICNHSNQVSWETNKTEIKSYCSTKPAPSSATTIGIGVIAGLAVLVLAVAVIIICKRKFNKSTESKGPEEANPNFDLNPVEEESDNPNSIYVLAQGPTGPVQSAETKALQPETVYALVTRAHPPTSGKS